MVLWEGGGMMRQMIRDSGLIIRMKRPGEVDPCEDTTSPATVEIDECAGIISFNGTDVPLSVFRSCLRLPSGFGPPEGPPSGGYLPFYLDLTGSEPLSLYAYAGGRWYKTGA